ncbi:MAG TPA: peptide deformylase [Abditibacteriaceae bacterium]|jgi:peptide deformylase
MVRPVLLVPDARLKTPCTPVVDFGDALQNLIRDLEDTIADNTGCVGAAACQIGEMWRVAIVDTSGHRKFGAESSGRMVLINPRIVEKHGERVGREGCLSLPDFTANVRRAEEIVVEWQDETGAPQRREASGFEAVAIQHEVDHCDGILFLDRVSNLNTDVFPRKKK